MNFEEFKTKNLELTQIYGPMLFVGRMLSLIGTLGVLIGGIIIIRDLIGYTDSNGIIHQFSYNFEFSAYELSMIVLVCSSLALAICGLIILRIYKSKKNNG